MVYNGIAIGTNISGFAQVIESAFDAVRTMERGDVTPPRLATGALWEKTNHSYGGGDVGSAVLRYTGSSHVLLLDPRSPQLNAGGTVALAANLNADGHKITGSADGSDPSDLATVGQISSLVAGAWTESRDAGGFLLTNLGSPFSGTLNPTGSDKVAARVDDLYRTADGVGRHVDSITLDAGGGEGNVCNGGKPQEPIAGSGSATPTFCPRVLTLTLAGDVTLVSGGGTLMTLARTMYQVQRLNADSGWIGIGSFGYSGYTISVEVEWITSGSRGFRVRLRRNDNALCTIATRAAFASFAVGMA